MDSDFTRGGVVHADYNASPSRIGSLKEQAIKQEKAAIDEILDWLYNTVNDNTSLLISLAEKLTPVTTQLPSENGLAQDNVPRSGSSQVYERLYQIFCVAQSNNEAVRIIRRNVEV